MSCRHSLIATLLLILTFSACSASGEFTSNRPPAADHGAMARQPAAIAFVELDANPALYRNQLIRVTGAFTPLPEPSCEPYKGPHLDWALIDQELRLDVQGFARVMALVPEGAPVTVDGFWQLYQGPMGCGKEPPRETLWYLRAVRLVQPNPLPQLAAAPESPAQPEEEATSTPQAEETGTPTPTRATPTPGATPAGATPTAATPTPNLTASPSPTPEATATPEPDGETPTPAPQETPTPGDDGGATPTPDGDDGTQPPPGETPTPSDYPGPTATPEPYD